MAFHRTRNNRTEFSPIGFYTRINEENLPNRAISPQLYRSTDTNQDVQQIKEIYQGRLIDTCRTNPLSDESIAYDISHNLDNLQNLKLINLNGRNRMGILMPNREHVLDYLDNLHYDFIDSINTIEYPKLLITPCRYSLSEYLNEVQNVTTNFHTLSPKHLNKSIQFHIDRQKMYFEQFRHEVPQYLISYVEQNSETYSIYNQQQTPYKMMQQQNKFDPWYISEYICFQHLSEIENVANDYSGSTLLNGNTKKSHLTFHGYRDLDHSIHIQQIKQNQPQSKLNYRNKVNLN